MKRLLQTGLNLALPQPIDQVICNRFFDFPLMHVSNLCLSQQSSVVATKTQHNEQMYCILTHENFTHTPTSHFHKKQQRQAHDELQKKTLCITVHH